MLEGVCVRDSNGCWERLLLWCPYWWMLLDSDTPHNSPVSELAWWLQSHGFFHTLCAITCLMFSLKCWPMNHYLFTWSVIFHENIIPVTQTWHFSISPVVQSEWSESFEVYSVGEGSHQAFSIPVFTIKCHHLVSKSRVYKLKTRVVVSYSKLTQIVKRLIWSFCVDIFLTEFIENVL